MWPLLLSSHLLVTVSSSRLSPHCCCMLRFSPPSSPFPPPWRGQMREQLVAENRHKFEQAAKAPAAFSSLQVGAYLRTAAMRRQIDSVRSAAASAFAASAPAAVAAATRPTSTPGSSSAAAAVVAVGALGREVTGVGVAGRAGGAAEAEEGVGVGRGGGGGVGGGRIASEAGREFVFTSSVGQGAGDALLGRRLPPLSAAPAQGRGGKGLRGRGRGKGAWGHRWTGEQAWGERRGEGGSGKAKQVDGDKDKEGAEDKCERDGLRDFSWGGGRGQGGTEGLLQLPGILQQAVSWGRGRRRGEPGGQSGEGAREAKGGGTGGAGDGACGVSGGVETRVEGAEEEGEAEKEAYLALVAEEGTAQPTQTSGSAASKDAAPGSAARDAPSLGGSGFDAAAGSPAADNAADGDDTGAADAAEKEAGGGATEGGSVPTYRDEQGRVRVSRVRGMGVRMTRDLQWNLVLMREREKERATGTGNGGEEEKGRDIDGGYEKEKGRGLEEGEGEEGEEQEEGEGGEFEDELFAMLVAPGKVREAAPTQKHRPSTTTPSTAGGVAAPSTALAPTPPPAATSAPARVTGTDAEDWRKEEEEEEEEEDVEWEDGGGEEEEAQSDQGNVEGGEARVAAEKNVQGKGSPGDADVDMEADVEWEEAPVAVQHMKPSKASPSPQPGPHSPPAPTPVPTPATTPAHTPASAIASAVLSARIHADEKVTGSLAGEQRRGRAWEEEQVAEAVRRSLQDMGGRKQETQQSGGAVDSEKDMGGSGGEREAEGAGAVEGEEGGVEEVEEERAALEEEARRLREEMEEGQRRVQELLQKCGVPYVVAPQEAEVQCAWLAQHGVVDAVELLQQCGVPYIIAPTEAEAQCAWLAQHGVVDAVVSDDCDALLFGAPTLWRHLFSDRHYVEVYRAEDVQRELGLSRRHLVRMAMLLGCDYTPGISGIGVVNAIEVIHAFPGARGLQRFRQWLDSPHAAALAHLLPGGAQGGAQGGAVGAADGWEEEDDGWWEDEESDEEEEGEEGGEGRGKGNGRKGEGAGVRRQWVVPGNFPSPAVAAAFNRPHVDRSTAPPSWHPPDLPPLRHLCAPASSLPILLPLPTLFPCSPVRLSLHATWQVVCGEAGHGAREGGCTAAASRQGRLLRQTQQRLEAFYSFKQRFAKIRSRRVQRAVTGIAGSAARHLMLPASGVTAPEEDDADESESGEEKRHGRGMEGGAAEQSTGDGSTRGAEGGMEGGAAERGGTGVAVRVQPRREAKRPRLQLGNSDAALGGDGVALSDSHECSSGSRASGGGDSDGDDAMFDPREHLPSPLTARPARPEHTSPTGTGAATATLTGVLTGTGKCAAAGQAGGRGESEGSTWVVQQHSHGAEQQQVVAQQQQGLLHACRASHSSPRHASGEAHTGAASAGQGGAECDSMHALLHGGGFCVGEEQHGEGQVAEAGGQERGEEEQQLWMEQTGGAEREEIRGVVASNEVSGAWGGCREMGEEVVGGREGVDAEKESEEGGGGMVVVPTVQSDQSLTLASLEPASSTPAAPPARDPPHSAAMGPLLPAPLRRKKPRQSSDHQPRVVSPPRHLSMSNAMAQPLSLCRPSPFLGAPASQSPSLSARCVRVPRGAGVSRLSAVRAPSAVAARRRVVVTASASARAEDAGAEAAEIEAAVAVLAEAARSKQVKGEAVFAALRRLETRKVGAEESKAWLAALGGVASPGHMWQLVFTAGSGEVRKAAKGGEGTGSYFPIAAIQRFDATAMEIENGVFLGPVGYLTFQGPMGFTARRLAFTFHTLTLKLGPLPPFQVSCRPSRSAAALPGKFAVLPGQPGNLAAASCTSPSLSAAPTFCFLHSLVTRLLATRAFDSTQKSSLACSEPSPSPATHFTSSATWQWGIGKEEDKGRVPGEGKAGSKDPFFTWFYVDDRIAAARGRGGGAAFWVEGRVVAEIGAGLCVLVGVMAGDGEQDCDYIGEHDWLLSARSASLTCLRHVSPHPSSCPPARSPRSPITLALHIAILFSLPLLHALPGGGAAFSRFTEYRHPKYLLSLPPLPLTPIAHAPVRPCPPPIGCAMSQFTLYGQPKGNKLDFHVAMTPPQASTMAHMAR
ncbi:unnamed protein product [Closterium sp. Naga37s-1]|nr:unnamed protein product [Closterium sp. Naga37s-1]